MPSSRLDIEVTEMKKTLFLKLKVYRERKLQKQGTKLKGDKLSNRAGIKHCVSTEGRATCQHRAGMGTKIGLGAASKRKGHFISSGPRGWIIQREKLGEQKHAGRQEHGVHGLQSATGNGKSLKAEGCVWSDLGFRKKALTS